MKKIIIALVAVLFLCCGFQGMNAKAADTTDMVVALGADLTADQRAEVLSLMGLTEADLANCTVVTVTNAMEHEYLDAYLDSSVIGTRALSSVKLTKSSKGSGVLVTTRNINYCTTGMYRNALLTAGMEDTEVLVVGPSSISGTAALIGALKAYEVMAGETISDEAVDTALDEMITTGELADSIEDADTEDVEALIAWLKSQIANGNLDTGNEESMRSVIEEGEETFDITLTDEEIDQIISLLKKLDDLGLNAEYLLDQAEQLFAKYGSDIVNNANAAIKEAAGNAVKTAVTHFFQNIKETVTSFFQKLFSK